ncbi:MAG: pyridoxal-dependent decarboxylase [Proteobacteria bacterium]|nr:pyridoxal-dependent decarboxylase [Pseudomonadota bacterium]
MERLQSGPVLPGPEAVAALGELRDSLGDRGIGVRAALDEFERLCIPASMAVASAGCLGLIHSSPLPATLPAELLVAALNNNTGCDLTAPAAAFAEGEVMRMMKQLVGWDESASAQLVPGGSYASAQATILARSERLPEWEEHGPSAVARPPCIYVSEASHFSATRSARVAGFGWRGVRRVPTRGRGQLDPVALQRLIARDNAAGKQPIAVIATAGTTSTGAVDPLAAVAEICREHGLWMHVDACYGGAGLLVPELADEFASIASADSIAIDPHKWMFMPLVSAVFLTRHAEAERRAFAVADAWYIPPSNRARDAFTRGVAASRRASALTLWLALRAHGQDAIRSAVRRNIGLARQLEDRLRERGFEVLAGGQLSTVCARWPAQSSSDASDDEIHTAICRAASQSGHLWLATTRHAGRTWLRFCVANLLTTEDDIDAIADTVSSAAQAVQVPHCPEPPHRITG